MGNRKIGQRIKIIRERMKLTQHEFGAKVGKEPNTICNYEKGDVKVSVDILVAIAQFTGVSIEWFAIGQETALDKLLSPEETELVSAYRYADEGDQEILMQMAKFIQKRKKEGV